MAPRLLTGLALLALCSSLALAADLSQPYCDTSIKDNNANSGTGNTGSGNQGCGNSGDGNVGNGNAGDGNVGQFNLGDNAVGDCNLLEGVGFGRVPGDPANKLGPCPPATYSTVINFCRFYPGDDKCSQTDSIQFFGYPLRYCMQEIQSFKGNIPVQRTKGQCCLDFAASGGVPNIDPAQVTACRPGTAGIS